VPICVQATPSAEWHAEKLFPVRTSCTHRGTTTPATWLIAVEPPVRVRRWNITPLPGVINTAAFMDPAAVLSRIITPDLAQ
jgi:hypothetical protein